LITIRLSRQEGLTIVRLLQDKKEVDDLSSFSKQEGLTNVSRLILRSLVFQWNKSMSPRFDRLPINQIPKPSPRDSRFGR
jgi:hypothetical protein